MCIRLIKVNGLFMQRNVHSYTIIIHIYRYSKIKEIFYEQTQVSDSIHPYRVAGY